MYIKFQILKLIIENYVENNFINWGSKINWAKPWKILGIKRFSVKNNEIMKINILRI